MNMKKILAAGLIAALAAAPMAHAAPAVTDGDFETSVSVSPDVTGWYDSNPTANFWEGAWPHGGVNPNGTIGVVFSSFESDDFGAPTPNANDGSWIYQSIGTADGLTLLELSLDW